MTVRGPSIFQRTGSYLLNVQAAGAWTIQIEQPDLRGAGIRFAALPQTFTGQGKQVSPPFYINGDLTKFHLVYDGAGPFKVDLVDQDRLNMRTMIDYQARPGGHVDAVSMTDSSSGPGNYLLDISAGGTYTITVEQ